MPCELEKHSKKGNKADQLWNCVFVFFYSFTSFEQKFKFPPICSSWKTWRSDFSKSVKKWIDRIKKRCTHSSVKHTHARPPLIPTTKCVYLVGRILFEIHDSRSNCDRFPYCGISITMEVGECGAFVSFRFVSNSIRILTMATAYIVSINCHSFFSLRLLHILMLMCFFRLIWIDWH